MKNKLIPTEYKGQRILTTKQLAEVYETDVNNIQANFIRNKNRFKEGKHYFKIEGDKLKTLKNEPTFSQLVQKHSGCLYLWTERGADRHCKILDTDKAWEQFDNLEDTYFRVKENVKLISAQEEIKELKDTVNEFKRLTDEAKQQYKPSHKMKLDYSKMIRALTNNDEEYDIVKQWVFGNLGYTKWEDACINDNKKIIDTINTVARLLTIKKMEQLSIF